MPPFSEWLIRVLADGVSVQNDPPEVTTGERAAVLDTLQESFADLAIDVGGPPILFDADAALGAAIVLARACWELVGRERVSRIDDLGEPATPSDHLSADVTLRFLPSVYRRARIRDQELAGELKAVFRRWPLSGVLADLDGEPAIALEFGGHAGLQQLYAERLANTGRAGWVPAGGLAREWLERVCTERGQPMPAAPRKEEAGD